MSRKILIVEDVFIEANNLEMILEKAGYYVTGIARSVAAARKEIERERPDFVLVDIFLQGPQTGIDLAWELKKLEIPFLYLSANSNRDTLEQAKKTGPFGFLVKPYRERDVLVMLEIAVYQHSNGREALLKNTSRKKVNSNGNFHGIYGSSQALHQVVEQLEVVAPTDTSVLLLGESGTGKERMAEVIHKLSNRSKGPLVKVDCASLPPTLIESVLFGHERGAFTGAAERRIGKFEQAIGGTLFLDEIGEMPLDMQAKLLRALQEREIERLGSGNVIKVDVRVIAATNRNLEQEVSEKRFRMDLYYRLNVFPVWIPPLRERGGDITLLANHFVEIYCTRFGKPVKTISPKAMQTLMGYSWPGNIRELDHVIERTVILTRENEITQFALTPQPAAVAVNSTPTIKTMAENEKEHIIAVLKSVNGKVSGPGGAAELLGLPPSTLNARMKKLGINTGKSFH
ncbi:DNA-binding transcriptional response regulator, NtrC family, contains REC, AAA-type ATPase, and a Fis-type DNA-binding domains [Chitinophaga jiangningensis]|uniref:DNA-binding transcriptional response regulator, NtrC family, contains REC, AAA-type ATPase, and a Fis-type DNA-binding domains n=1 Tax=Chitinophaga jiangningensis TaxID=1419482 RepID=A0A1M6XUI3_9BACT|nr:sigma-54 dependent transcriptional regulator [Chitinophaga jiangningensis]SHL09566.1 DNA-binding transcriptional response regulator, NtrC family, contains REC, AAA-type ATPase, and a Fis-type DNA-binding domains [Chitinophaga jiangningensis]